MENVATKKSNVMKFQFPLRDEKSIENLEAAVSTNAQTRQQYVSFNKFRFRGGFAEGVGVNMASR